jgi:putative Holliday junction resolvase
MSKILAVDVGRARVGLALSDATATLASPRGIISRADFEADDFGLIRQIIAEEGVELVIVGHPLSLNGSVTSSTEDAENIAGQLTRSLAIPIKMVDERLTSKEARKRMAEAAGRKAVGRAGKNSGWERGQRSRRRPPKKMPDDAGAATVILQSYLDGQK